MNVLETCIHDPLSEFVRKGEDAKDRFFPAAHPPLQGQRAPVLILRLSFSDFLDAAPSAPPPVLLLPPPPRASPCPPLPCPPPPDFTAASGGSTEK